MRNTGTSYFRIPMDMLEQTPPGELLGPHGIATFAHRQSGTTDGSRGE